MITKDITDDRGIRRVRVEPETHEAPKLDGWKCFFVGFVGTGNRSGVPGHTTFSYRKVEAK